MKVRVKEQPLEGIPVKQMKDGQLGIILYWGEDTLYLGRVIQRCEDRLISIGLPHENSFPTILTSKCLYLDYRVRILQHGEVLVLEEDG